MSSEKILSKIKSKHRITNSRIEVIKCLQDSHHSHTINDIVKDIKLKNAHVNVASVYNNINLLLKEGMIDVYPDYQSKNQLYELVDKNKMHIHLYFYETEKQERYLLPDNVKEAVIKFLDEKGYDFQNIKIEILAKKNKN